MRPSTNQLCPQTRHHDNPVSPLSHFSRRTFPSSQNNLTSSSSSSLPFSSNTRPSRRRLRSETHTHRSFSHPPPPRNAQLTSHITTNILNIATVPQQAHSPSFPPLSIPRTSQRTKLTTKTTFISSLPSCLPPHRSAAPSPPSHQPSTIRLVKLLGKAAQQSLPSTASFCTRSTRLPHQCQHKTINHLFVNPIVKLEPFPNNTLNGTNPFPFLLPTVPFSLPRNPLFSSSFPCLLTTASSFPHTRAITHHTTSRQQQSQHAHRSSRP